MADEKSYDELETDFLEEETESGFLSLMSVVIAFIAVAVFIILAWYAYQTGTDSTQSLEELEVVYPEEGAIRTAPEEPGGWQFPDQDKSVYNIISGEETDVKVEKILPEPEQPMARPEAQTEMWIRGKLQNQVDEAKKEIQKQEAANSRPTAKELAERANATLGKEQEEASKAEGTPTPSSNMAEAPEPEITGEAKMPAAAPVKPKSEPVKVAPVEQVAKQTSKTSAPTSATLTAHRLQLGAVRSNEEAKQLWLKLSKRLPDLVAGKAMHIERADLKAKGVYYRVQIYPFASRGDAQALCDKLSARGQACFAVKR
jgi:cell division protein FtsN